MRILVTGGAGYIGSVAVRMLLENNHDVSVLDDLSSGHRENIPSQVEFFEGSLLNNNLLVQALKDCDAVIHFAGKSLVGESVNNPELYKLINVDGSKILLEQMKAVGVKKLVFSSSAATYGSATGKSIIESDSTLPTNPYGLTKLQIEELISNSSADYGLCAISLRYFNVAGALETDSGWLSEKHDPETHLIPNILNSSVSNPLSIFGADWPTPDGTCIRDYVHVVDLIKAHIAALDLLDSPSHSIFNLGSGVGYSVLEILKVASDIKGEPIPYLVAPRRDGDPATLVANVNKAREILKWTPTLGIEEMIADTYLARNLGN